MSRPGRIFSRLGSGYSGCKPSCTDGRHAIAKRVFSKLDDFVWWRVIRMLMTRHRWNWGDVRRQFVMASGQWRPIAAGEIRLRRIGEIRVSRYLYRGEKIPGPWAAEPA